MNYNDDYTKPDPHLWGKSRRPQRNPTEAQDGWRHIKWMCFIVALVWVIVIISS